MSGGAGDQRVEDVRVADLFDPTDCLLGFQAVDHRLDGCVGGAVFFRKGLLNFSDRRRAVRPERLHDLQFQSCQLRHRHWPSPIDVILSTTYVGVWQETPCGPTRSAPSTESDGGNVWAS